MSGLQPHHLHHAKLRHLGCPELLWDLQSSPEHHKQAQDLGDFLQATKTNNAAGCGQTEGGLFPLPAQSPGSLSTPQAQHSGSR